MFKLKQDIILFLLFLCLLSCSSNPKSPIDPKKNIFITKPEITFNIKNLPKQINVFYLNSDIDPDSTSLCFKASQIITIITKKKLDMRRN